LHGSWWGGAQLTLSKQTFYTLKKNVFFRHRHTDTKIVLRFQTTLVEKRLSKSPFETSFIHAYEFLFSKEYADNQWRLVEFI
jgi:hypothetical protein